MNDLGQCIVDALLCSFLLHYVMMKKIHITSTRSAEMNMNNITEHITVWLGGTMNRSAFEKAFLASADMARMQ